MFKAFALQPLATKVEQITSQKKKVMITRYNNKF